MTVDTQWNLLQEFERTNDPRRIEALADRIGASGAPGAVRALLWRLGDWPVQEDPDVEDAGNGRSSGSASCVRAEIGLSRSCPATSCRPTSSTSSVSSETSSRCATSSRGNAAADSAEALVVGTRRAPHAGSSPAYGGVYGPSQPTRRFPNSDDDNADLH